MTYLFVDGRKYDWPNSSITGAQLRALVPGLNPQFVLMQEVSEGTDSLVTDSATYAPGESAATAPQFYTAPPATFGSQAAAQ